MRESQFSPRAMVRRAGHSSYNPCTYPNCEMQMNIPHGQRESCRCKLSWTVYRNAAYIRDRPQHSDYVVGGKP